MSLRFILLFMTLVAVVSDYMLHPFYPQFFNIRFGVTDPKVVGYYFAALCFMVMISFPFWAYVSKKKPELKILIITQCIAGILALCCFTVTSYVYFWIVSLTMVLFKGSYLLVYPYILKIIKKEAHAHTIGVLSVIVHLGGVLGAVIGGLIVDQMHASYIFLIMALGDFIQMGLSWYVLKSNKYAKERNPAIEQEVATTPTPKGYIIKIGLITLVLYFSDFLIRPFFSRYWEFISDDDSTLVSGIIYAIPALVALFALWFNKRAKQQEEGHDRIISYLLIGMVGLFIQGIPLDYMVIIGRIIYGWAIFQGVVRFDALLFEHSSPESYSVDYSKVHFFQNLGVLIASFTAGILVDQFGLYIPFVIALLGFVVTFIVYLLCFKTSRLKPFTFISPLKKSKS